MISFFTLYRNCVYVKLGLFFAGFLPGFPLYEGESLEDKFSVILKTKMGITMDVLRY